MRLSQQTVEDLRGQKFTPEVARRVWLEATQQDDGEK